MQHYTSPYFTHVKQLLLFLQMCDFLENEYLEEQVKDIKELSNHITNLRRVGPGLGEFMFDKETFECSS